jgi:hypothetical protein
MTYLPCTENEKTVNVEGRFAETPFNIFQHTIHYEEARDSPIIRTAKALCAANTASGAAPRPANASNSASAGPPDGSRRPTPRNDPRPRTRVPRRLL